MADEDQASRLAGLVNLYDLFLVLELINVNYLCGLLFLGLVGLHLLELLLASLLFFGLGLWTPIHCGFCKRCGLLLLFGL